jgi:hypothetical protein
MDGFPVHRAVPPLGQVVRVIGGKIKYSQTAPGIEGKARRRENYRGEDFWQDEFEENTYWLPEFWMPIHPA